MSDKPWETSGPFNFVDDYTPTVVEGQHGLTYGEVLINLVKCPSCGRWMVDKSLDDHYYGFPAYSGLNLRAQMIRADWRFKSDVAIDNKRICEQCAAEGKASFVCSLCGERRDTKMVKESFGDPPEYLCRECYVIVPAAVWDAKVDELQEAHQYDFE
jgi:hypothetical protein